MIRIRYLGCCLTVLTIAAGSADQLLAQTATATATPATDPTGTSAKKIDPIEAIKDEGLNHSQVMKTLGYLSDIIGPRLTGSPGLKRANEWTRDKMAEWGLTNAHLETWGPFGKGWTLKKYSAQVIEPQCIPLIAYPKAWSTGVGPTVAEVVYFDAKSEADFAKFRGKLSGKIVLNGVPREVKARFEPLGKRKTDTDLLGLADSAGPNDRGPGAAARMRARGGPGGPGGPFAFMRKKIEFLVSENPTVVIDPSQIGDGGTLFVASASVPTPPPATGSPSAAPARRVSVWDKDAPAAIPQLVMSIEHYNRLVHMIEAGETPKMAVELEVEFQNKDLMAYNTIAEIAGTDLKNEVVMLGGHIDSWHSGTGTTDNGAGISAAMEAVRILKAKHLQPRRTIRVGLWSGEEQGLFGSRAYVKEHFGTANTVTLAATFRQIMGGKPDAPYQTKPEYEKFSVYFNLDNGSGKVRGVYLQGNDAARPIFRNWLTPFRDLGATTVSLSNTGGTDHLAFDAIGLPGFQFIQDEIEYNTRTHHSNQDVFDRAQGDDLKQASVIMATFVYNAATMDEKFPRKPLPKQPPPRGQFDF